MKNGFIVEKILQYKNILNSYLCHRKRVSSQMFLTSSVFVVAENLKKRD
jgi:hypothetical protein